jgi:hypothetical protein
MLIRLAIGPIVKPLARWLLASWLHFSNHSHIERHKCARKVAMNFVSHFVFCDKVTTQFKCQHEM